MLKLDLQPTGRRCSENWHQNIIKLYVLWEPAY
jgi:hypothetical protein